jgi:hypothetical protein
MALAIYTIQVPHKPNGKIDYSSSTSPIQLLKFLKSLILDNDDDIVLTPDLSQSNEYHIVYKTLDGVLTLEHYDRKTFGAIRYSYDIYKGIIPLMRNANTVRIGPIDISFNEDNNIVISKRGPWWPEYTEETPLDALRRVTLRF